MKLNYETLFLTMIIIIIELLAVLILLYPRKDDYKKIITIMLSSKGDIQTPDILYKYLKRMFDFIFSFVSLIIFSPILLVVLLLLKLEGINIPIIKYYCIGYQKKTVKYYRFNLYDDKGNYTAVTKFLRNSGLDYLPSLFSIFCGDLSVVGLSRINIVNKDSTPNSLYLYDYEKPGFLSVGKLIVINDYTEAEVESLYLKVKSISFDLNLLRYMLCKVLFMTAK